MTITIKLTAVAAAVSLLTGCANLQQVEKDAKRVEATNDALGKRVGQVTAVQPQSQPVVSRSGIYVGRGTIKLTQAPTLPEKFGAQVWFTESVQDLRGFAQAITKQTGIPAKVSPEAFAASKDLTKKTEEGDSAQTLPALPAIPGTLGAATPSASTKIAFSHQGDLSGLLDVGAARFGVSWRFQDGEIQFVLHETKTYFIKTVPGSSKQDAQVSSAGTGAAASGGTNSAGSSNTASTSVKSDLSIWTALEDSIKAMLTEKGKVVVSPATTSVTVTDTPSTLRHVTAFIDAQNAMISKQVMLTVQVLQVSREDTDDYSIKWDAVYNNLYQKYGISNAISPANGSTQLSLGIVKPSSKWNGSQAIISALSEQATVHLETSSSVVALNNQPAPIQTITDTVYLASSSTTSTPDAGTTTSLTPGNFSTGFAMHVLPTIMHDGSVFLQLNVDVSSLKKLREITSDDAKIEAPEIAKRSFLQRVKMKTGETLVLSGFEQTDGNARRSGVGSAHNFLLGGGASAERNKDSMVILVTPVIVGG